MLPKIERSALQIYKSTTFIIIMTCIFTIFTGIDIQIKFKVLDYINSANPQVA